MPVAHPKQHRSVVRPPALHPSLVVRSNVLLLALDLVDSIFDKSDSLKLDPPKTHKQLDLFSHQLKFCFPTWQAVLFLTNNH